MWRLAVYHKTPTLPFTLTEGQQAALATAKVLFESSPPPQHSSPPPSAQAPSRIRAQQLRLPSGYQVPTLIQNTNPKQRYQLAKKRPSYREATDSPFPSTASSLPPCSPLPYQILSSPPSYREARSPSRPDSLPGSDNEIQPPPSETSSSDSEPVQPPPLKRRRSDAASQQPRLPPLRPVSQPELDACLNLCISLLDHRIVGRLEDSLVVGFVAVDNINQEQTGFNGAVACTPGLSALIKLAQILLIGYAHRQAKLQEGKHFAEVLNEAHRRFMVYGSHSPFNWLLSLRAYGSSIRCNTTSDGWIEWSNDGQNVSYKGLAFSMLELRWTVYDLLQDTKAQLAQILLTSPDFVARFDGDLDPLLSSADVPLLPRLTDLKDDPKDTSSAYCFTKHPLNRTALAAGARRYLLQRVYHERPLMARFFDGKGQDVRNIKLTAVHRYLHAVDTFLHHLLVLFHVTGGQPARATELLTVRWRNSDRNALRNIFIEDGLVVFVTQWHKGRSASGAELWISRYLPAEVGRIVVYYLWLVMPFLADLNRLTRDLSWPTPDIGSFLWPATLHEAAEYGPGCKKRPPSQYHRPAKTPKGWEVPSRRNSSSQDLPPKDLDKPWDPAMLRDGIRLYLGALGAAIGILVWRHLAIAISRYHLPEGSQFSRDTGQAELKEDAAIDLQAAHSSKTAAINYGRTFTEGRGFTHLMRWRFRTISRQWHRFLLTDSKLPPRPLPDSDSSQLLGAKDPAPVAEPPDSLAQIQADVQSWHRAQEVVVRQRRTYKTKGYPSTLSAAYRSKYARKRREPSCAASPVNVSALAPSSPAQLSTYPPSTPASSRTPLRRGDGSPDFARHGDDVPLTPGFIDDDLSFLNFDISPRAAEQANIRAGVYDDTPPPVDEAAWQF